MYDIDAWNISAWEPSLVNNCGENIKIAMYDNRTESWKGSEREILKILRPPSSLTNSTDETLYIHETVPFANRLINSIELFILVKETEQYDRTNTLLPRLPTLY